MALSGSLGAAPIHPYPAAPPLVHARYARPQHGGIALSRLDQTSRSVRMSGLRQDDAIKLSHQLISLPVGNYDQNKGSYFGVPTVVNGRVYVGYGSGIAVFGELQ